MFPWIAILYAATIPIALMSNRCSCGNCCCHSPTLEKASSGFSSLRPLFRYADRLETVVLAPVIVIIAILETTLASLRKCFGRTRGKDQHACFLPAVRSVLSDSVIEAFNEWEHSLASYNVQNMGDYLYRANSIDRVVRYLLPDDRCTIVEAYWLVDHFELSCFSAFEDGSYVNTHMVDQKIVDSLGLQHDSTSETRRRIVMGNSGAVELYKRHHQYCLEWSSERGTTARLVSSDNYKDLVVANEVDQNRAATV